MAFYVVLSDINTSFKQVSTQLSSGTDAKLSEVIYSEVLELFLENSPKVVIYKVLVVM
jgi:hypothetical protein